MLKAGLDESKAGINISGRNINNLRYADDTTLMAESEEELKDLLRRVKEESAKAGLLLNVKKTKIMANNNLSFWQIDGEEVEAVTDFIFLGSKISSDGDYSHEIKRCLFLEKKAMASLDKLVKTKDITLSTKDINECILKNYAECSNPRLFYIIPYFCGQHPKCRDPGEWALERAKQNVNENFLLVGILEELEDVLLLLERFLPHYFKDVMTIYKNPGELRQHGLFI
ncbi:Hypothetical predicted protein [Pelobates cultripes]|uniref:Reverse transcriptase domain-containing protein n=1 Tax=Pelobates cultripes TaxID=61616 RepID=A0AAD1VSN2_PELCU|nr:Hypothetical predicted protein [Pelobates cultripes]